MTFMRRDVIRFRALDFVLRIVLARVVGMSFVVEIFGVYLDDVPLTCPASEFQVTLSPTVNCFYHEPPIAA